MLPLISLTFRTYIAKLWLPLQYPVTSNCYAELAVLKTLGDGSEYDTVGCVSPFPQRPARPKDNQETAF